MAKYRGAGTIRWKASDGRSPYIGANGNWWQWNSTVNDFVDTGVKAAGVQGMPGKIPFQKEWRVGDTHRNNTNIVDYIYVRAALAENRKWYKLNDTYITRTVPAGETEPSAATIAEYYEEIPWLSALAVNVLIAEEANLANFIFKEGKLISIRGRTYNNTALDYGEYIDYNFANTVSQPAVDSSDWTDLPSGTIYWVRYKKNTDSTWTVKQIGTGSGQWTLQFATAPDADTWYSSYSDGRYWARAAEGGSVYYGLPFKITMLGEYDFNPNIILDGETGTGQLSGGNIKWNVAGNIEFFGGIKSPFADISSATIANFWDDEITSWANNFFENQATNVLIIRIIPCSNLLNGQVFRIHALRKGITLQPEEYNGFYENGTLLNEIQLLKGDAIEMVCICYDDVFHSWDIIRRYKCRPYDQ